MSNDRAKTCGNCRWWQTLKEFYQPIDKPEVKRKDNGSGICRRLSPGVIDNQYRSWPGTLIIDWCGEWAHADVPAPDCPSCRDTGWIGGTADITNCKRCNTDKHIVWSQLSLNGGELQTHPAIVDPTGTGNGA